MKDGRRKQDVGYRRHVKRRAVFKRESRKYAQGKTSALQQAVALGLEIDRNPFEKKEPREALVQCWICNLAENRSYGIGRPSEVRCSACGSRVEVLTVDGKPV